MKRIVNEKLGETLYRDTLKNGLTLLVLPKKGFAKTYAVIATNFGSVDTMLPDGARVPDGIAHFLEHKMFEGETEGAFERYARTGANANAFTSFDKTAYLFACTEQLEQNVAILLDLIQHPYFTEENVKKEMGIIGQEIRMYDDDPSWRCLFGLLSGIYHNNYVKLDIAGSVESISQITPDWLNRCYRSFYHPSNMAFCMVGDCDPEAVRGLVERYLVDMPDCPVARSYPEEPASVVNHEVRAKLTVSAPQFLIGFKDNDPIFLGMEFVKKQAVSEICLAMLGGAGAPCGEGLYRDGLIPAPLELEYLAGRRFGVCMLGGESHDPAKVRDTLLRAAHQLAAAPDAELFERSKRSCYGDSLRRFNQVERLANDAVEWAFLEASVFDPVTVYDQITLEDVSKRLQSHFIPAGCVLSVIEPAAGEEPK